MRKESNKHACESGAATGCGTGAARAIVFSYDQH
jgi:hypothetical protein